MAAVRREALYIAVRAEYPEWIKEDVACPPSTTSRPVVRRNFDFFIIIRQMGVREFWHICGNPNGALFERHLADHALGMAGARRSIMRAPAHAGVGGEFKLPFKALGSTRRSRAISGGPTRSSFDCGRASLSTWSPCTSAPTAGRDGLWLVAFGGDNAAVRFEQGVDLSGPGCGHNPPRGPRATVERRLSCSVAPIIRRRTRYADETRPAGKRTHVAVRHSRASMDHYCQGLLKQFTPLASR